MKWNMIGTARHYTNGTQRLTLETAPVGTPGRRVGTADVYCQDQHPHPRRWCIVGPVVLRDGSVDPSPKLGRCQDCDRPAVTRDGNCNEYCAVHAAESQRAAEIAADDNEEKSRRLAD